MSKKLLLLGVLLATLLPGAKADVDPNFYIYICFGQSNMEGNAQPETMDRNMTGIKERFQLLATCKHNDPSRVLGKWYNPVPPLVSPNGGLGPTDYFGRTMIAALPANVKIGVIPVAMGGSPIEMFDKDLYQQKMKDNPTEWWVTLAKNHYNSNPYGRIIDMAKKAQEVGVIKGILLHQGCSNCGNPSWPGMVNKIYNDMLTDLNLGADSVPLFVGEVEYQDQGGSCSSHNAVVAKIPSTIKTGHVVSAKDVPGNRTDPWHFSAVGYRILGKRYAMEALKVMNKEVKPDAAYTMPQALQKFYGAKSLAVTASDVLVPGEAVSVTATFGDNHKEDVSQYVTFRSDDILIQDGKIVGEGEGTLEVVYLDFCNKETTASKTVRVTFFPFTADYLKMRQGSATVDLDNRTITFPKTTASQAGWQYDNNVDWSAYRFLVIKLKEAQTSDLQVRIYKKNGSSFTMGYMEAIGDRTVMAIDLQKMEYNKKTMDPSAIGKVVFHSTKVGTLVLDNVFLSNDMAYAEYSTGISDVSSASPFRAPLYSLDGRLAQPDVLKPGVYIQSGKKKVIR